MAEAHRATYVRRLTQAIERCADAGAVRRLRWERALWAGDVDETLDLLGDEHPDAVHIEPTGEVLIHAAIGITSPDVLRLLIERGADVNYPADDGFPALVNAITHYDEPARRLEVVRLLLDAGADVHRRGYNHWTPLHTAALTGDADLIEALLDAGADPEATTIIDDDFTPEEEAYHLGVPAGAEAIRRWREAHR